MSLQTSQHAALKPTPSAALSPVLSPAVRHAALRGALLATVGLLKSRRASEIDPSFIDDYVALNWMEWNGGGLRLTTTGENICKQLAVRGPDIGE